MTTDPWCVTVDMGSFDLIVVDSPNYQTCQSYLDNCQHLYKDPVTIMLKSQVRLLIENWMQVEVCTGAEVRIPEKAAEQIKP